MKLTIFAATGGIGRLAMEQAIAAGHDVTAVVRNPKKLSAAVRAVTADLTRPDPAVLESAVKGANAVLSGLGPRSMSETGVASQGTRAILAAMKAVWGERLTTVFVRQGHYAHDAALVAATPAADLTIESIAEIPNLKIL